VQTAGRSPHDIAAEIVQQLRTNRTGEPR